MLTMLSEASSTPTLLCQCPLMLTLSQLTL